MIVTKKYNYFDFTTFLIVFILMAFSVLVVYSASSSYALTAKGDSEHILNNHLLKLSIAVFALIVGIMIDYKKYQKFTKIALIIGIATLVAALLQGNDVRNTERFINLGFFKLQPSEFVKFILIAHLANLLASKSYNVRDFKYGYLPLLMWIIIISGLVMVQPNFSMGSIILITGLLLVFVCGVRFKHLILTLVPILPAVMIFLYLGKYRATRIVTYIHNFERMLTLNIAEILDYFKYFPQESRALGQLWQSVIAFGNGGFLGVGLGNSRQRDFYIPEAYNDFIFSIIGEEYGILGTVVIVGLFILFFLRGLKIANYAKDDFGKFLALGITITITSYAIINASVNLTILPATGLPMPFVSYGGNSVIASAFAVGVLLNISKQTDLNPRITRVPVVGTVNAEAKNA